MSIYLSKEKNLRPKIQLLTGRYTDRCIPAVLLNMLMFLLSAAVL